MSGVPEAAIKAAQEATWVDAANILQAALAAIEAVRPEEGN